MADLRVPNTLMNTGNVLSSCFAASNREKEGTPNHYWSSFTRIQQSGFLVCMPCAQLSRIWLESFPTPSFFMPQNLTSMTKSSIKIWPTTPCTIFLSFVFTLSTQLFSGAPITTSMSIASILRLNYSVWPVRLVWLTETENIARTKLMWLRWHWLWCPKMVKANPPSMWNPSNGWNPLYAMPPRCANQVHTASLQHC